MRKLTILALLFALFPLSGLKAQYPGQYPSGGGQYPPGQYPSGQGRTGQGPMGGSGIPIPWGHKKSKEKKAEAAPPNFSAEGKVVSTDGKQLLLETKDGRTLTLALTAQTKYTKAGAEIQAGKLAPHATVHVDASEDEESNLTAVKVELLKEAPTEREEPPPSIQQRDNSPDSGKKTEQADNSTIPDPTKLGKPPEDPNRPVLRRGKPQENSRAADEDVTPIASNRMPEKPSAATSRTDSAQSSKKEDPTDFTIDADSQHPKAKGSGSDLIAKTMDWAESFTNGLPNFVCQQMTTRYVEQSRSEGWQPVDIVSAKVIFEEGKERYQEITVGGKKTNKSMLELGGSTSTGEFASTLQSLFSPRSQAEFKFVQSTTIGQTAAAIYDFKVALANSDWFIRVGGQSLKPAYSGSVWIDRATSEVRRIEMQADRIPKDYPLDTIQWAVDYDTVRLGTASFLLPVHAENLGCQRGTTICSKNTIDFRDYHKYSGESTITFK